MTVSRIISESVTTKAKPEQARRDPRGIRLQLGEWMVTPVNRPILFGVIDEIQRCGVDITGFDIVV
jgi:hypothetical protein